MIKNFAPIAAFATCLLITQCDERPSARLREPKPASPSKVPDEATTSDQPVFVMTALDRHASLKSIPGDRPSQMIIGADLSVLFEKVEGEKVTTDSINRSINYSHTDIYGGGLFLRALGNEEVTERWFDLRDRDVIGSQEASARTSAVSCYLSWKSATNDPVSEIPGFEMRDGYTQFEFERNDGDGGPLFFSFIVGDGAKPKIKAELLCYTARESDFTVEKLEESFAAPVTIKTLVELK